MVGKHVDEWFLSHARDDLSESQHGWFNHRVFTGLKFHVHPFPSLSIHPTWVNWNMCHGQVGLDQPSAGWEDGTCQSSSEFSGCVGMIGWDDAHIFGMARWVFITPIFRFWSGKPETRPCADGCSWSIWLAHLNVLNMFDLECECIYAFCGILIIPIMTRLSFLGGHLEDTVW